MSVNEKTEEERRQIVESAFGTNSGHCCNKEYDEGFKAGFESGIAFAELELHSGDEVRAHGSWIDTAEDETCSLCNYTIEGDHSQPFRYCPMCGARMEVK